MSNISWTISHYSTKLNKHWYTAHCSQKNNVKNNVNTYFNNIFFDALHIKKKNHVFQRPTFAMLGGRHCWQSKKPSDRIRSGGPRWWLVILGGLWFIAHSGDLPMTQPFKRSTALGLSAWWKIPDMIRNWEFSPCFTASISIFKSCCACSLLIEIIGEALCLQECTVPVWADQMLFLRVGSTTFWKRYRYGTVSRMIVFPEGVRCYG